MKSKDRSNNKIQYEKIGDIYYPVFNDMQPSLGFYAKKRKEYLKKYYTRQYVRLLKDKQYKKHLFILNCYCEQLFQKQKEEILKTYTTISRTQLKNISTEIQMNILNEYVYQTKEVIFDGKDFKITE